MSYDPSNVFAKILRQEIPAQIVHEDERCVCFADVAPQAPTHLLLIPKAEIPRLVDADPQHAEVLGHLLLVAGRIAREQGFDDAFRLVINNGEGAGQTVFHLHLHLMAGRPMAWPPG